MESAINSLSARFADIVDKLDVAVHAASQETDSIEHHGIGLVEVFAKNQAQLSSLISAQEKAMQGMGNMLGKVQGLDQIGVRFALDDFGTGYSSLTYLKQLRVALLKIDQSFVRDMLDDPDDLAILQDVIGLAAAFKREVIAEGVETVAHGTLLLQLGCDLAQGYGIARPMPPDEIPEWASSWHPVAAWTEVPLPSGMNQEAYA